MAFDGSWDVTVEPWDSPEWDEGGRVHNWRNHVPQQLRDIWDTFTEVQKKILYDTFDEIAGNERWD